MKKLTAAILMIVALFLFAGSAQSAIKVYGHNIKTGIGDLTMPGYVGTKSTDNVTLTWALSATNVSPANVTGAYFWIKNVDGNATSVKVNFYTSFFQSGNNDWAEYMPTDPSTKKPTAYDLTMPGANATWNEPIPFPEGTQSVKAVVTISDNESTDNVTIKMIPSIK